MKFHAALRRVSLRNRALTNAALSAYPIFAALLTTIGPLRLNSVVLFTIGNIISILGSFFLNGPYAQGKKMVGPQMRCATFAYLTAMVMTFFVCFYDGIKDNGERLGLVIMLIIVQYCCMIWFIICSVYFLKKIVLACLKGTCTNMCPTVSSAKKACNSSTMTISLYCFCQECVRIICCLHGMVTFTAPNAHISSRELSPTHF